MSKCVELDADVSCFGPYLLNVEEIRDVLMEADVRGSGSFDVITS